MAKKLTDDEIMAAALKCPESKKVPLEVGDRVIALERFDFWNKHFAEKGSRGVLKAINMDTPSKLPLYIHWDFDSVPSGGYYCKFGPIGKLVPRRK